LKSAGRGKSGSENAGFLSQVQSSCAIRQVVSERMQARQIQDAGDSFKTFVTP